MEERTQILLSERRLHTIDFNLYDILNKANNEDRKQISSSGEQRGDEWGGGAQGIFTTVGLFCMTL